MFNSNFYILTYNCECGKPLRDLKVYTIKLYIISRKSNGFNARYHNVSLSIFFTLVAREQNKHNLKCFFYGFA